MVLSMERWVRHVAVVTGASAGIGAAIAEELVKQGLKVVGLARRKNLIEELSWKLSDEKGKLYAFECDITVETEIHMAFKWIEKHIGPVSILVNNAGLFKPTSLSDGDVQVWRQVFETNVIGLCMVTKQAINQMKENKISGHIIHINSIEGHRVHSNPLVNVYPASKHAVTALAETLRHEMSKEKTQIKITSISPGAVKTGMLSGFVTANPEITENYPNPVTLQAKDVADAVVYALSTPAHVNVSEITIQAIGEYF